MRLMWSPSQDRIHLFFSFAGARDRVIAVANQEDKDEAIQYLCTQGSLITRPNSLSKLHDSEEQKESRILLEFLHEHNGAIRTSVQHWQLSVFCFLLGLSACSLFLDLAGFVGFFTLSNLVLSCLLLLFISRRLRRKKKLLGF